MAKTSSSDSSRGRLAALLLAVFTSGWFYKLLLVALVLLGAYTVYLDAQIRASFEGKKWQVPARVYARPLELYVDKPLASDELITELSNLGYTVGSASAPGGFFARGGDIVLHSRGYQFWDAEEPPRMLRLQFTGNRISRMVDMRGQPQSLARLEPMEIGAIYPSHREDRVLLQLQEVPPLLLAALVAVEDHRFYEHHGVSLQAILRATVANLRSGSYAQGGSTLTQQLVKNYYLTRERSLRRKFTEAIMSLLLEVHYEKEAILEAYLNEVYLGQSGARAIHGFGLGASHYFNRPLAELSIEKLALLIAVIRGPAYYDPWRYPQRALERRNRVLDTLARAEIVSAEDVEWAKAEPLNLGKSSRSQFAFPAYMDLVKRQLREHYPQQVLTSEGLKIYTALDPLLQRRAEQAVAKHLQALGQEDLESSVVATEPSTGELLALVGGKKAGYAGFNRALNMQRSVGSVIKPFVYLAALQQPERYTLATLIDDSPISLEQPDGGTWSPRNFDRESHGQVPLIEALAKSYNQATARLGNEIGLDRVVDVLDGAGLEVEFNAVPSLFIGTTELSPLQVAQLYQSLAAGGYATPIRAIRSVLDSQGNAVQRFPYDIRQAYDAGSVYLLSHAMQAVARQGSGRRAQQMLGDGARFAAKTGTSGQGRDAWFAGFSGDMQVVVWTGYDDNRATELTGSRGALPIWADIVAGASHRSLSTIPPMGVVERWVDADNGQPSRSRCANAVRLPFIEGSEPSGRARCYSSQRQASQ